MTEIVLTVSGISYHSLDCILSREHHSKDIRGLKMVKTYVGFRWLGWVVSQCNDESWTANEIGSSPWSLSSILTLVGWHCAVFQHCLAPLLVQIFWPSDTWIYTRIMRLVTRKAVQTGKQLDEEQTIIQTPNKQVKGQIRFRFRLWLESKGMRSIAISNVDQLLCYYQVTVGSSQIF